MSPTKRKREFDHYPTLPILVAALFGAAVRMVSGCEMKEARMVEVPDERLPRFPECAICGRPQPEPLTTQGISDESAATDFAFYRSIKSGASMELLEVPAHDACAMSLRSPTYSKKVAKIRTENSNNKKYSAYKNSTVPKELDSIRRPSRGKNMD